MQDPAALMAHRFAQMAEPPVVLVHDNQRVRIWHNRPIVDSVRRFKFVHYLSLSDVGVFAGAHRRIIASCRTAAPACGGARVPAAGRTRIAYLEPLCDRQSPYMDVILRYGAGGGSRRLYGPGCLRGTHTAEALSRRSAASQGRARDDLQAALRRGARALRMSALVLRPGLSPLPDRLRRVRSGRSRHRRRRAARARVPARSTCRSPSIGASMATSRKVSNLINMMPYARHDLLVMFGQRRARRPRLSRPHRGPACRIPRSAS